MIIVIFKDGTLFLLLLINICGGYFHAPLHRVIPLYDFKEDDIDLKSAVQSPHKMVKIIQTDVKGIQNRGYYISLGIGTPPQKFNFIIDTGSSNTAVAGEPHPHISNYFHSGMSSSFIDYGIKVFVPYESGSWNGHLSSEIFTMDAAISIRNISQPQKYLKLKSNLTLIQSSKNFFTANSNWEGILGLAYSILSRPDNIVNKQTFIDKLVESSKISNMFSLVLCGHKQDDVAQDTYGYFIAGGMNKALFVPPMINIMIRRRWFYEIIISRISISNKPIIISSCKEYNTDKTILDSGTTDILLPTHVFRSLVLSIINNLLPHPFPLLKSSPFWDRKAVLCTPSTNLRPPPTFFPEVDFHLVINDTASLHVALSAQQYIAYIGNQIDIFGNIRNCYKFGFGESKTGTILGDSFFEGFYLLFNRANDTIGIAQSTCNSHYPGMSRSRIIKVYTDQGGLLSCGVKNNQSTGILGYFTSGVTLIVGLVFGLILILALIVMIVLQWRETDNQECKKMLGTSHTISGTTIYKSFD